MKDDVKATDEVRTTLKLDISPARFCKVQVLAESGIFKQGKQYDKGAYAVLESRAAERLKGIGDVKIIREVKPAGSEEVGDHE